MFDRRVIVTPILTRGLAIKEERMPIDKRQRLVDVVPEYPSPSARVLIRRRVRTEMAFMWPGLDVALDLRDDSTISDLIQQLAGQLDDWFGD